MTSATHPRTGAVVAVLGLIGMCLVSCGPGTGGLCAMSADESGTQSCGPWRTRLTTPPDVRTISPTGAPGLISLKVRRVDAPGAAPVDLGLHCQGGKPEPDSTVPDPAAACTLLMAHPEELDPVPRKGVMCSQLYGGPEKATVNGVLDGKVVKVELSRTDGCKTAQWKTLAPLLGNPAGGV